MSRTILLADDSVTIQKVVELTFMDEDYQVVAVSNGNDAVAKLSEVQPDLVITDVHMPGPDGYEVCRQAKELRSDLPVLLLVGTFEAFNEEQAQQCGAAGHLKKPFDSQELLRRVDALLQAQTGTPVQGAAAADEVSTLLNDAPSQVATPEPGPNAGGLSLESWDLPDLPASQVPAPPDPGPLPPLAGSEAAAASPAAPPKTSPPPQGAAPTQVQKSAGAEAIPDAPRPGVGAGEPAFGTGPEAFTLPDSASIHGPLAPEPPPSKSPPTTAEELFAPPAPHPERQPSAGAAPDARQVPTAAAPKQPQAPQAPAAPPVARAESPQAEAKPGVHAEPGNSGGSLSEAQVEQIARRVAEIVGDKVAREVAWEIIPDLAEVIIRDRLRELESQVEKF